MKTGPARSDRLRPPAYGACARAACEGRPAQSPPQSPEGDDLVQREAPPGSHALIWSPRVCSCLFNYRSDEIEVVAEILQAHAIRSVYEILSLSLSSDNQMRFDGTRCLTCQRLGFGGEPV